MENENKNGIENNSGRPIDRRNGSAQQPVARRSTLPGGEKSYGDMSRRSTVNSQPDRTVGNVKKTVPATNSSDKTGKRTPKKKKEHPALRRFGIIFCSLCLIGIISVSSVGLYVLKYVSDYVNGPVQLDLDECKANQSKTTILYTLDDDGREVELIRLHGAENRIWVDLKDIPKNLQNAYIALEDQRFKKHAGVDWIRTIGVMVVPSNSGQGGSTITQQLIKNLTGERDVTYVRKFKEIQKALNLEKHYSKETILEAYLNTLYLDAGCYGVQTASEYYFGKDVNELNLAECACIAAITKGPRSYNPILNPENNKERADYALECMLKQGFITQEEYDKAMETKLIFTTDEDYVPKDKPANTSSNNMIPVNENNVGQDAEKEEVQGYYIDYVIDKVISDLMEAYSYSHSEAWRLVYYGGLKIHVAVDMGIQKAMEDVYYNRKGFPTDTNSYGEKIQSCMVIMDYSGRVMGIVGQAGEKEGARCLNIATDSMRQPGSSIKPLSVYSLAIDSNEYTWSYPMVQNYGILRNGERWPYNFGKDPGSPYHYETLQQALAPSHNTVPAQIIQKLGVDTSFEWLRDKFRITSLYDEDRDYSPLAVGGMSHGVYPIEMCAAYTVFGNGGVYHEPYCYYTVTNNSGSTVYLTHNDSGEQILKPGTADVMNKLLQTVVTSSNGTGRNYKVNGFEMFAKTGTTSDEKDRWFIGGTPYYVCTAWIGYAEHAEQLGFSTNYCGELYQTVMNTIHKNLPAKSFEFSDDVVEKYYCTRTGRIATSACPSASGWYKVDSIPSTCTSCGAHVSADPEPDDTPNGDTTTGVAPDTPDIPDTPPVNDNPPGGDDD